MIVQVSNWREPKLRVTIRFVAWILMDKRKGKHRLHRCVARDKRRSYVDMSRTSSMFIECLCTYMYLEQVDGLE